MRWPTVTAFGVSLIICVFAACNGGGSDTLPTAPSAPIVPPPALAPWTGERSEWTGTTTLVSCSGNESRCSSFNVGQIVSDRRWFLSGSGATIDLYAFTDDMAFRGTVDGRRFVATYPLVEGFPEHAMLEGEFAEDFNSFEAVSTHVIAVPVDYQTVVHYRVVRDR